MGDGAVVILRSRLDASKSSPPPGKGSGKPGTTAKAPGFTSVADAAAKIGGSAKSKAAKSQQRAEKGIHIDVACPDGEHPNTDVASGHADTAEGTDKDVV